MSSVIYIAGPFRHYLDAAKTQYDRECMQNEIHDEQDWAQVIADAGHMWIAPLCNSEFMQGMIPDEVFIERDLEVIRRLNPATDALLLRPGAYDTWETSVGAMLERDCALEHGLEIINGTLGMEAVAEYLRTWKAVA